MSHQNRQEGIFWFLLAGLILFSWSGNVNAGGRDGKTIEISPEVAQFCDEKYAVKDHLKNKCYLEQEKAKQTIKENERKIESTDLQLCSQQWRSWYTRLWGCIVKREQFRGKSELK